MGRHPLDALAKALATGTTRRQIARGLTAAVALLLARGYAAVADDAPTAEACAFLDLINAYRVQNGLAPLALSPTLSAAATTHAHDMAAHNYLGHTLADGASAHQNMINAGYPADAGWGENVYAGYGTEADGVDNASALGAFTWWQNSPDHDANMLNPTFAAIGVSRAYNANSTYQWYWATAFGGVVDGVVSCDGGTPPGGDARIVVGDHVQVQTDDGGPLNLRQNAGLDAAVLDHLPTGDQATVLAGPQSASGHAWYQLTTTHGDGWSVADYLVVVSHVPPPPGEFQVGAAVQVITDRVNLRADPGLSAPVLAVLVTGAAGTVMDGPRAADGYDWYQLQTDAGTGWCASAFLGPSSGFQIGAAVVVDTDALHLRATPSVHGVILATLPTAAALTIRGGPASGDGYTWWQVERAGVGTGWVDGEYLGNA